VPEDSVSEKASKSAVKVEKDVLEMFLTLDEESRLRVFGRLVEWMRNETPDDFIG